MFKNVKLNWVVVFAALTFSAGAMVPVQAEEAVETPNATLALESTSVAIGIGYSWGEGEVTYQGKKYDVDVSGMSVVDLGVASLSVAGDVYHLNKLEDLNGTYFAVSAGIAIAGGGEGTYMKNQNGVVIKLAAAQEGVKLKFGPEGIKLKVKA